MRARAFAVLLARLRSSSFSLSFFLSRGNFSLLVAVAFSGGRIAGSALGHVDDQAASFGIAPPLPCSCPSAARYEVSGSSLLVAASVVVVLLGWGLPPPPLSGASLGSFFLMLVFLALGACPSSARPLRGGFSPRLWRRGARGVRPIFTNTPRPWAGVSSSCRLHGAQLRGVLHELRRIVISTLRLWAGVPSSSRLRGVLLCGVFYELSRLVIITPRPWAGVSLSCRLHGVHLWGVLHGMSSLVVATPRLGRACRHHATFTVCISEACFVRWAASSSPRPAFWRACHHRAALRRASLRRALCSVSSSVSSLRACSLD